MPDHNKFLKRCFELAQLGETYAFPNPIVGCVIVPNGEIISEGFHRKCGEAHAEVNAVNSVLSNEPLFKESTIYVSLEPCAHHGRTAPCADLIIKHKFKRLVFSSYDPNPLVSGQGIQRIREAGIEVIEPKDLDIKLVEESNWLNRVFFKLIVTQSQWITLKIAATAEGSMISDEKWITNSESRKDVHRLRSTHQLLVTSIATVRADNPLYTVRHSPEELGLVDIHNPDIAILKSNSDFTDTERKSLNIFQDVSKNVFEYKTNQDDSQALERFIEEMVSKGYQKIMIEAGPRLSQAFLESGLVDEIVHYAPTSNNSVEKISNLYQRLSIEKQTIRSKIIASESSKDYCVILKL